MYNKERKKELADFFKLKDLLVDGSLSTNMIILLLLLKRSIYYTHLSL